MFELRFRALIKPVTVNIRAPLLTGSLSSLLRKIQCGVACVTVQNSLELLCIFNTYRITVIQQFAYVAVNSFML